MIRTFKIDAEGYPSWTILFGFLGDKTASAISSQGRGGYDCEFVGKDMGHKNWLFSGRLGLHDSFVTDFISLHYADWASGSTNTLSANMVETTG